MITESEYIGEKRLWKAVLCRMLMDAIGAYEESPSTGRGAQPHLRIAG